jgi:hypothetical protein
MEQRQGYIEKPSRCFRDHRDENLVTHSLRTLLTQRVFGLCQGYEDLNDHDTWRSDPLLGIARRSRPRDARWT